MDENRISDWEAALVQGGAEYIFKDVLGTYRDKDIHTQLSQLKLPLFQLSMLLDLFILKNNFIKSAYNIWSQCL